MPTHEHFFSRERYAVAAAGGGGGGRRRKKSDENGERGLEKLPTVISCLAHETFGLWGFDSCFDRKRQQ